MPELPFKYVRHSIHPLDWQVPERALLKSEFERIGRIARKIHGSRGHGSIDIFACRVESSNLFRDHEVKLAVDWRDSQGCGMFLSDQQDEILATYSNPNVSPRKSTSFGGEYWPADNICKDDDHLVASVITFLNDADVRRLPFWSDCGDEG